MKETKCLICNTNSSVPFLSGLRDRVNLSKKVFNFRKCRSCSLVYQYPMPDETTLAEYYKYYPYEEPSLNEPYQSGIQKQIVEYFYKRHMLSIRAILERVLLFLPYLQFVIYDKYELWQRDTFYRGVFRGRGKLLDVGCGHGSHMLRWRQMGFEVMGIDIDERSLEFARKNYGFNVRSGDLFECKFQAGEFDAITMCHSLEHLPDPIKVLKEVHRILKNGGELILWLPNIDSVLFKLVKRNWHGLETPRHLYHYNARTLTRLLALAGFSVRRILYEPYEFGYKNSVKYFGQSRNLPRSFIGVLKNLVIPFTFFSYIFRRGDNIIVRAVKK